MPSIKDLKNKKNKIYEKKDYRPWTEKGDSIKSNEEININIIDTTELEKIWRGLYGAKKIILNIILNNIEEDYNDYLVTNAITTNKLVDESSLPINTIKSALHQLKQNNIILNYENKPGKGGFARYQIPKNIYEYFINKYSSDI